MENYFFPGADYLQALSYFRLCLWNESTQTIKKYYKLHRKNSSRLRKILIAHKKSKSYFIKLILMSPEKLNRLSPFVYNLSVQIKKKVKFNTELYTLKKLQRELKHIKKLPKNRFTLMLNNSLSKLARNHLANLNYYVKEQMVNFLNEMHRFSYEMSQINLQIISKKRFSLDQGTQIGNKRARGSLDNVRRTSQQHFYTFNGEFWVDELGTTALV